MKYIFVSFLCHLFFAQVLVLTFTPRPVAHKPLFVFLGSILESQDFANLDSSERKTHISEAEAGQAFPLKSQQNRLRARGEAAVIKPSFSGNVRKGAKEILKSTFEETAKEKPIEKDWAKELGIELTVPQRRPLRLHF